jgi:thiamine biosynthesis lipoprotein
MPMQCITTGTAVWSTTKYRPAFLFLLLSLAGSLPASERIESFEPHMGTTFRIVLYADDVARARDALRAAFNRVADLDRKLSDYLPDSELNRVCVSAVGQDVPISDDLYVVLLAAQALAERTDGAFDVTLGPVIRLWRTARKSAQLPDAEAIKAALQRTGYRMLHLADSAGHRTIRLDREGMQLDLGAIAKGYAADEALRVLRERGFPQAVVAASGDIAIGDAPPSEVGWETGIDSIDAQGESFTEVLTLHNAAVSTSGDTEQSVQIAGVRYSHIVNPATGNGLTHRIGVTVIAAKGIDSDALSTAASVVTEQHGPEQALALIEQSKASGIIITEVDGSWKRYQTQAIGRGSKH